MSTPAPEITGKSNKAAISGGIGNELLERKQYLVGVNVIEARNIQGVDMAGTSDPFVRVTCAGEVQQTQKKYEVNSCTWNQSLSFPGLMMNIYELETFELNFELLDHNNFMGNEFIGQYSVGLSTLYRNLNHEFYKNWVGLFDKENPNKVSAFLQISCFIIGPGEKPPVHGQDEADMDDDLADSEEDEQVIAAKIANIQRAQGIVQVNTPGKIHKSWQMSIIVVKAENLPLINSDGAIKPFVSARVFGMVLCTKCRPNANPKFNAKLQFPIYYPILNNKITMRVWSQTGALSPNVFIANIPEHPSALDPFNLTKLMSQDGRMPLRWINLYGTKPLERSSKTKMRKEGTSWLGRVLIAFNLVTNERPMLGDSIGPAIKEPKAQNYQLWVDLYDLINCDIADKDDTLWIQITIGPYETGRQEAKYNKKLKGWRFKNADGEPYTAVEDDKLVEMSFPQDLTQIPDIFINVYTNSSFSGEERVAYLRLPVTSCIHKRPKPNWFRLSTPYNDADNKNMGMLMLNVQFLQYDSQNPENNPVRMTLTRAKPEPYKFFYQIIHGFELASNIPPHKLETKVEVMIGDCTGNKVLKTKDKKGKDLYAKGRYPIWNYFNTASVKLQGELTFESDMRVTIQNKEKGLFGACSDLIIGEFSVPVASMMKRNPEGNKPQFFNILNDQGQFVGQVLANFYLMPYELSNKQKKQLGKGKETKEFYDICDQFLEAVENVHKVKIDIAMFGIRNLINKAMKAEVTISVTNDFSENAKQVIFLEEKWLDQMNLEETANPNFGQIISFPEIDLPKEPLCWPYIEISIRDLQSDGFLAFGGCEECFTTLSLLEFANLTKFDPELLEEQDIKYARAQLARNQDNLQMVQNQLETKQFLKDIGILHTQLNFDALAQEGEGGIENADQQGEFDPERASMRQTNVNGMQLNMLENGQDQVKRKQGTIRINLFQEPEIEDDLNLSKNQGQGDDDGDGLFKFNMDDSDEEEDGARKDEGIKDFEMGVILDMKDIDTVFVTENNKLLEDKVRNKKIANLDLELRAFAKKLKSMKGQSEEIKRNKDKIKIKMMYISDDMESLREEKMNEEKFWGMAALNDDDDAFDYGRDILKEVNYEALISLPYYQFPLFTKTNWHRDPIEKPTVQMSGILRSGNISGASIKAQIMITNLEEFEQEEEVKEEEQKDEEGAKGEKWDQILEVVNGLAEKYPFSILDQQYLDCLMQDQQTFKVRVYLITAQNLTASGTVIDWKSRLAGMTALSVASGYPVLKVGDGLNDHIKKITKTCNDREETVTQELNPQFFRTYEMDAQFPDDWKLEISIMDKASIEYADQLIGTTIIDIENRHLADTLYLDREAIKIEFNKGKRELKEVQSQPKTKEIRKQIKAIEARQLELKLAAKQIKPINQILVPVEFRELIHPLKSQAQGMVETWAEVLTFEDSQKIATQKMKQIAQEKFEIRLIIWETREVPLVDGDDVDIFVRVVFDPTGWADDEVEKKTDVHKDSKTGWGQFNWRMKFELDVPCDFPRIKFTIHDQGVFTDEAVGEATINLKRTVNKLQKEGFIEVPKTYVQCWHPNKPGEERGYLMFSMTILSKEDADGEPVGEAQEEPNENPFLKKPTAGRGFSGGFSIGGLLDLDLSFNPFGKFLPFLAALFIILALLTYIMYEIHFF